MKRRSILKIGEDIFTLLNREDKLSAHAIARKVKCERRTAMKVLEFLCFVGVLKEKKISTGEKRYERVFSLR